MAKSSSLSSSVNLWPVTKGNQLSLGVYHQLKIPVLWKWGQMRGVENFFRTFPENPKTLRSWTAHVTLDRNSPGPAVICGLSLLLVLYSAPRGFFSGYSGFPLTSKTNISKFQFDPGMHGHFWTSFCELLDAPWVHKLHIHMPWSSHE